jgi:dihydroorotase-like cyclic amidohydrolase
VPASVDDGTGAEIAALAADGHPSFKVFLSDPQYAAGVPDLPGAFAAAGRAGALTLVHCEDAAILERAGQDLIGSGHGAMRHFPDARPVSAEVAAVGQAISLARETGAPVYIVHLSSAAALDRCRQARAAGLPVYVETRPLYLHLTRERFEEPDAAKYAGAPPLGDQCDRDALWRGLAAGDIDTVCSDHAPSTLDSAGLAPVRDAPRPGRTGRRQVPGPAGAGTMHPAGPGSLPADWQVVTSGPAAADATHGLRAQITQVFAHPLAGCPAGPAAYSGGSGVSEPR